MTLCTLKFLEFKKSKCKIIIIFITVASFFIFSYMNIRPQMLTFILIMSEILSFEKYLKTKNKCYLLILPITMIIEANCHASYWVMHIVVLLPYFAQMLYDKFSRKKLLKMLALILVLIGCTFLNPYGSENVTYVFKALLSNAITKNNITECMPFNTNEYYFWIILGLTVIFTIMLIRKKLNLTDILMYLGFLVLISLAIKWASFYNIAFLFLMRKCTHEYDESNVIKFNSTGTIICIVTCFFTIISLGESVCKSINLECINTTTNDYLYKSSSLGGGICLELSTMADYLDKKDSDASVYCRIEQSNYMEFRGYKIYMDARPELYIKGIAGTDEITNNYLTVRYGYTLNSIEAISYNNFVKAVNNINTDYYIVDKKQSTLYYFMETHSEKYKCVQETQTLKMYKKI